MARTIEIVRPGSRIEGGNHVTAARWQGFLEVLGCRVSCEEAWSGRPVDLLVALHAGKSHDSVVRFRREHPGRPVVVAATGTDVYADAPISSEVEESLLLATRIVVLQPRAIAGLPAAARSRARVVYQSVPPLDRRVAKAEDTFQVASIAHLRPVKDPLLPAEAARRLPASSRIRVVLVGALLDDSLREDLERALERNPRVRWTGGLSRAEALEVLAASRLCVSSSRHEGGSNAVSEAIALGVGVLATEIEGNLGLLGEDHSGLFPVGDAPALAERMLRAESDETYLHALEARSRSRAWMTQPARELDAWRSLLDEILGGAP